MLIVLFLLRIYKTQKSFEQEVCMPCRKYSCILSICLSKLSEACWGHMERGWLCVRSHGESDDRYVELPVRSLLPGYLMVFPMAAAFL